MSDICLPFELIEATEHHGPYIVNAYGDTVCDFYFMTIDRKPVMFDSATEHAAFVTKAANSHDDLVAALKDALRSSRKDFKAGLDGDRQHCEAYAEQFAALAKARS